MEIITQNTELNNINQLKGFWLHFYIDGEGGEFLDYDLPYPTYLEHYNKGYAIAWLIDGFFGTKKGEEFLNDVIARFLLSFADLSPKRLPYKPEVKNENKTAHILSKAYKLKEFSNKLKSIPSKKKFSPNRADMFEDFIFWAIKLYAEDTIRKIGIIPNQEYLEDFALNQFVHKKDRSTLKAKCKSIYNYYDERDFNLPKKIFKQTKGEYKMTRIENMKKINEERAKEKKRKVLNAISGMFSEDLKKKNGKWNIAKISRELNISENTVKKYIKEFKLEKRIRSNIINYKKDLEEYENKNSSADYSELIETVKKRIIGFEKELEELLK